jgi:hypothetical protein
MASCALTQGYSQASCGDLFGGVPKVYIIEKSNITSYTVTSGVVTAITKATAKLFRLYDLKQGTADGKEVKTVNKDTDTSMVKQTVAFPLQGLSASLRTELELVSKNLLTMVLLDDNGTGWLYGKDKGVRITTINANTGKLLSDANGYELTFEGDEKYFAYPIDSTTLTSLTVPGV